jgi:uncharacterized protein (DUF362 family)
MADLYINYGTDLAEMTVALMEAADISARLRPDMRVVLKPNLVVARPADGGATTHPEILEGAVRYLQKHGITDITVAEGSWVGDSTKRAWKTCGYEALAKRYNLRLLDTKDDAEVKIRAGDIDLRVCKTIVEADFLINFPVLKGHCQTDMTCCLKNMKGCIPDSEKRRYHTMGLHRPIAALNTVIKPDLHIVDGVCGDLSFEEGGNPVQANRIMLGFDPALLDSYGAQLMGFEPDEIGYLRLARDYGVGRYADAATEIVELNAENKPATVPSSSRAARSLAPYIDEDGACSACYAALIFALDKAGTGSLPGKVHIGQGFRGKTVGGIGVGNCTQGCDKCAPGCPPKAVDIVRFLREL